MNNSYLIKNTPVYANSSDNKTLSSIDSFEKKDRNNNKIKIIKFGAILSGISLAILAFIKRKQIGNAISNLIHKKTPDITPSAPSGDIPSRPKTPDITPHLDTKGITPAQELITQNPPTLDEYTKLCKEFEELKKQRDINDPIRKAAAKRLNEMEKQMIEHNISFLPKAPESFSSEQERWNYFYKFINMPVDNEATAMDILDHFSRLGGRMYDKNKGIRSITDIPIPVLMFANEQAKSIESSNRILQKYVDSVFKFATNDIPPLGYSPDAAALLPAYNDSRHVMTKDTVIKFIDAFKRIAVDKQQYKDIHYFLQDGTWQMFYPQLKQDDMPDIYKALDSFAKVVESLPYKINNGY